MNDRNPLPSPPRIRISTVLIFLTVVLLIISAVLAFAPILGIGDDANAILTVLVGLGFIVMHGGLAFGWKRIGMFVLITVVVSFCSEALGVATGLVFGSYYYTDNLGPKILGVPPLIQAGYVAMSYASLVTARIALGALGTTRGWRLVGVAICGAMIMVGWDVAMDPYQSTIGGDWIWRDGGPYFGVPLHNYAGWFGTVVLFMLLYLAYEQTNPLPPPSGPTASRLFWSEPVVYYALIAVGIIITPCVWTLKGSIASPANYSGSIEALEKSLSLVGFFVMGIPVAIAVVRLLGSEE